jgi:hypothetical protein
MAAAAISEIQVSAMSNCHPILMQIDTQTKKIMLSSKITKRKCAAKNCKN